MSRWMRWTERVEGVGLGFMVEGLCKEDQITRYNEQEM